MGLPKYIVYMLLGNCLMSGFWYTAWLLLAEKLMDNPTPKRRKVLYVLFATLLQQPFALSLQFSENANHILTEILDWNIFIFTLQGVFMVLFLYRKCNLARAICSVALTHFFIFTAIGASELLVMPLDTLLAEHFSGLALLLSALIIATGANILSVFVSALVVLLLQKTGFVRYYSSLFGSRRKGLVMCAGGLLVMHSLSITLRLFPGGNIVALQMIFFALDIALLFAVLFIAVFEANRERVKQQETYIVQQQSYVHTLEGLQQDLRAFRHDYQNLLGGLYLQASEGDYVAIQDTLKNTMHYFDDRLGSQIHRVTELSRVEIPAVKSLLLVKLMQAEEAQVPVRLEIPSPVTKIAMGLDDFLRCLGILADNAIEACAGLQDAEVRIALLQEDNGLMLVVANPVVEKPRLHQMDKLGYTTKGESRGTGLAGYKRLIGRYSNVAALTKYEQGELRQSLHIRGTA